MASSMLTKAGQGGWTGQRSGASARFGHGRTPFWQSSAPFDVEAYLAGVTPSIGPDLDDCSSTLDHPLWDGADGWRFDS